MIHAFFITDFDGGWRERERENVCVYVYYTSNVKDSPPRIKILKVSEGQLEKHQWRGLIFSQLLVMSYAVFH